MLEKDFQKLIIEMAQRLGWAVSHFMPAQRGQRFFTAVQGDSKGFPDLVLVRERVIFAELKLDTNYLRGDQKLWQQRLHEAGAEVYVWKPKHLLDSSIEEALRSKTLTSTH